MPINMDLYSAETFGRESLAVFVDIIADEKQVDDKMQRRNSVPPRQNNVDEPQRSSSKSQRVSSAAVEDVPAGPSKSSQLDKGELEQPESQVHRQRRHRMTRIEQLDFEPGPQRTSTPSPTYDRREALPPAVPAVPPAAVLPPSTTASSAGSQSRPYFQPVVADQLPVPVASAPTLHLRKPDVISDVNDEVAEPVRPAPRTDRYRQQRTSRTSRTSNELQPLPPPQQPAKPTPATHKDSLSDTSSSGSDRDDDDDDDDDDEEEGSDASDAALLRKQVKPSTERLPPPSGLREDLPADPAVLDHRARVRSVSR